MKRLIHAATMSLALCAGLLGTARADTGAPAPAPDAPPALPAVASSGEVSGPATPITFGAYAQIAQHAGTPVHAHLPTAMRDTCWESTGYRWYRDAAGRETMRFFQRVGWCGDGRLVRRTDVHENWAETYVPGWRFTSADRRASDGVGHPRWVAASYGHFCLADPGAGCLATAHPWLRHTARADGTFAFASGA